MRHAEPPKRADCERGVGFQPAIAVETVQLGGYRDAPKKKLNTCS
jgi:hypothetical protein